MTASPINASKITVMKMAIAMDDVIRIWKSVESSYKIAKRRLAEARSLLYSDTKKAYKLVVKARSEIIEESKAAQEYNRYRRVIPQISDDEVSKLDKKYNEALERGDYRGARSIAVKLSECQAIVGSGHSVSVRMESCTGGKLCYVMENESTQDIDIKRFTVNHNGSPLVSDALYPFTIRHNSPMRIRFDCTDDTVTVIGSVEYTENGIVKVLTFSNVLSGGE